MACRGDSESGREREVGPDGQGEQVKKGAEEVSSRDTGDDTERFGFERGVEHRCQFMRTDLTRHLFQSGRIDQGGSTDQVDRIKFEGDVFRHGESPAGDETRRSARRTRCARCVL